MLISSRMEESGVAFGTSGARGLVSAMTDRLCFAYVTGYLQWMREVGAFLPGMEVALAGDLRPSAPRILRACMAAVRKSGGQVLFCGFVPTPCLSLTAFRKKIPSLMVTGSHIPADRNGIKFNRESQEFSKEDEAGMRRQHVTLPAELFNSSGDLITAPELPAPIDAVTPFLARYRDFFGENALQDMVIGVYQHSSVARDLMVDLINALGGRAVPFGRETTFHPIDTEALAPEDTALLQDWAARHNVMAIISSDGDADRPLLTDQHGNMIRGDIMGLVTARLLKAAFVATPVTSNTMLELSQAVPRIARTKIGSPYVLAAMPDHAQMPERAIIGYEANGGLILGQRLTSGQHVLEALPTRDFALPLLATLISARTYGNDLTRLVNALPKRVTASACLKNMPLDRGLALVAHVTACAGTEAYKATLGINGHLDHIDELDGTRMFFTSGVILHIRPSGNAPELRVYVEASTQAEADRLLEAAESYILTR
ncbi:phosphomannomutase [Candidatus Kirkpatrickella diaphorinae]|uniref:Phosphomannomutase n=1 Tax=Candidatus Kirkpatrickella diaphorinae TaxID=2984322 RepID=A0ABY6GHQ7_9PROT|nr:phosphomannomutase [Candidatus Kirkpatrickella diaphorinae]UYH51048.1 phosphomannomutase [Candidatus Kirkpatrickella diaphorinae]